MVCNYSIWSISTPQPRAHSCITRAYQQRVHGVPHLFGTAVVIHIYLCPITTEVVSTLILLSTSGTPGKYEWFAVYVEV